MWKDHIDDAIQKFPQRGLHSKMLRKYRSLPRHIREQLPSFEGYKPIRDEYGVFAFATPTHLFVAKNSPYGDIVSVNTLAWKRCIDTGRKVIIYIDSSDSFYEFDPALIFSTRENMRGSVSMTNFDIRQGVKIVKVAAGEIERPKPLDVEAEKRRYNLGVQYWNSFPGEKLPYL